MPFEGAASTKFDWSVGKPRLQGRIAFPLCMFPSNICSQARIQISASTCVLKNFNIREKTLNPGTQV